MKATERKERSHIELYALYWAKRSNGLHYRPSGGGLVIYLSENFLRLWGWRRWRPRWCVWGFIEPSVWSSLSRVMKRMTTIMPGVYFSYLLAFLQWWRWRRHLEALRFYTWPLWPFVIDIKDGQRQLSRWHLGLYSRYLWTSLRWWRWWPQWCLGFWPSNPLSSLFQGGNEDNIYNGIWNLRFYLSCHFLSEMRI